MLGQNGLFVTPPLEDCLIGLKGFSTMAGTGCTDLQLIFGSVVSQSFVPGWFCVPRHERGRGCMAEVNTARVVLPGLVSFQHRHKSEQWTADCQTLTWHLRAPHFSHCAARRQNKLFLGLVVSFTSCLWLIGVIFVTVNLIAEDKNSLINPVMSATAWDYN